MKTKSYFVTNSSSVSFILSDFRDKGGDIIVHFNASKEYNIVELTTEEVLAGTFNRKNCEGEFSPSEHEQAKNILNAGGKVHYCIVRDERLMDFLERKKGIEIVTGEAY